MPFKSFHGQDIYIKKYTRIFKSKHLFDNVTSEQITMSKTKTREDLSLIG